MKPISALKKAIVTNLAKAKAQLAMLESTLMKCNKVVVFTDMLTTVTIDREKNKYVINGNVIATEY